MTIEELFEQDIEEDITHSVIFEGYGDMIDVLMRPIEEDKFIAEVEDEYNKKMEKGDIFNDGEFL